MKLHICVRLDRFWTETHSPERVWGLLPFKNMAACGHQRTAISLNVSVRMLTTPRDSIFETVSNTIDNTFVKTMWSKEMLKPLVLREDVTSMGQDLWGQGSNGRPEDPGQCLKEKRIASFLLFCLFLLIASLIAPGGQTKGIDHGNTST